MASATKPLHNSQAGGAAKGPQKRNSCRPARDSSEIKGGPAWGRHTDPERKDTVSSTLFMNTREKGGEKLPDGRDDRSMEILRVTFDEVIVSIELGSEGETIGGLRAIHNLVEYLDRKDLWDIMEAIAGAAVNTEKSVGIRAACLNKMIFLHEEIGKKAIAEGRGEVTIVVGSKRMEGRAQSGIPPVHFFQVDREGGEGDVEEEKLSLEDEMLMSEKKMAAAILEIWGSEEGVLRGAAERAIAEIDSPILKNMASAVSEMSESSGLMGVDAELALDTYLNRRGETG